VCPAIAPVRAIRVRFSVVEAERVTHPLGVTRRVPFAELPARPLPYGVVADLGFDLGVVHPGIVVPGAVIGAHMFEAEPVVTVEFEARFWCAKLAPARAARVLAGAHRRFWLGREDGIGRDRKSTRLN